MGQIDWRQERTAFGVQMETNGLSYIKWKNDVCGLLVTGRDSRPDISLTYLQPFLSYTTKTQTSFGLNTESTYNWKNDKWTVPVNASVTQVMKIGGQPVSLQVGGRYYATGPSGTPDWGLRCQFTLLFPK